MILAFFHGQLRTEECYHYGSIYIENTGGGLVNNHNLYCFNDDKGLCVYLKSPSNQPLYYYLNKTSISVIRRTLSYVMKIFSCFYTSLSSHDTLGKL